jgi:membrane protease YdiL (CAAX protease family)
MTDESGHSILQPAIGDSRLLMKVAALIEVAGIIALSSFAVLWVQPFIAPGLGETLGLLDGSEPDFIASASAMLKQFGIQYCAVLIMVLVLARLQGGRPRQAFALTRSSRSIGSLILLGLVAGFIVSVPVQFMFVARDLWSIGDGTALWMIADRVPWDWTFWLFMGVGSFAIVPIVEELTWRGYVLGRLVENFGPGGALIVTTLFFSLLHLQYFVDPDPAKIMTIFGLLFGAVVFGLITLHTGSIVPAIIAHAVINTPATWPFGIAKIVIGMALVLMFFRSVRGYFNLAKGWLMNLETVLAIVLVLILAGLGRAGMQMTQFQFAAIGLCIGFSLVLGLVSRTTWKEIEDE